MRILVNFSISFINFYVLDYLHHILLFDMIAAVVFSHKFFDKQSAVDRILKKSVGCKLFSWIVNNILSSYLFASEI